jgi:hypothetical protein
MWIMRMFSMINMAGLECLTYKNSSQVRKDESLDKSN